MGSHRNWNSVLRLASSSTSSLSATRGPLPARPSVAGSPKGYLCLKFQNYAEFTEVVKAVPRLKARVTFQNGTLPVVKQWCKEIKVGTWQSGEATVSFGEDVFSWTTKREVPGLGHITLKMKTSSITSAIFDKRSNVLKVRGVVDVPMDMLDDYYDPFSYYNTIQDVMQLVGLVVIFPLFQYQWCFMF